MKDQKTTLKRSLSLPLITFYGLGNILGAGIYVLVGKVATEAGYLSPLSFFVASIIAAVSAFSYAELSSRYPVSAGEAVYVYEGFGIKELSMIVGLLMAFAGIVSSATIAHGFAGYIQVFIDVPQWLMITLMLLTLGALASWGITQSVHVAVLLTLAEIAGLLIIIFVGIDHLPQLGKISLAQLMENGSGFDSDSLLPRGMLLGVFTGAFLAFYAYIGFEDMVNVAEEVNDPQHTMPRAILLCVIISTLLYSLVSLVAISVLTPEELSRSDAALASVYTAATGREPVIISVIGVFAVINGALIQIIMVSRLLYGMSARGWLPGYFEQIHPETRTPLNSTILVVVLMLLFALLLPMVTLAEMTSYLVLTVFFLVNLALIRIKRRDPKPEGIRVFPVWLPVLGLITVVSLLLVESVSKLL